MNREIKFRAWWTKTKKMTEPATLNKLIMGAAQMPSHKADFSEVIWLQDTGLKDKNGKEIYEGDIVNGLSKELGGNITRFTYEIFWDNEWKGWGGKNGETRNNPIWGTAPWENLEIIGNIYENPELLNQ